MDNYFIYPNRKPTKLKRRISTVLTCLWAVPVYLIATFGCGLYVGIMEAYEVATDMVGEMFDGIVENWNREDN